MSLLLLRFEFCFFFKFFFIRSNDCKMHTHAKALWNTDVLIKVLPVTTYSCYLFLGINNTGPLISSIHMHILDLHGVCGLWLPSVTPQVFLPSLQPQAFVATVYSSGTPLGSWTAKKCFSRTGDDGGLIFKLDDLLRCGSPKAHIEPYHF